MFLESAEGIDIKPHGNRRTFTAAQDPDHTGHPALCVFHELRICPLSNRALILAPGNYGLDYLHERYPEFYAVPVVKTSNFIGDTLDMAAAARFEEVLLVGHVGKPVKVSGLSTARSTAEFISSSAITAATQSAISAVSTALSPAQ